MMMTKKKKGKKKDEGGNIEKSDKKIKVKIKFDKAAKNAA